MSDEAQGGTHVYVEIEADGRYQLLEDPPIEVDDVRRIPLPPSGHIQWLEVHAQASEITHRGAKVLVDYSIAHQWRCALRVDGVPAAAAPLRDPTVMLLGSDGALHGSANCTLGARVVLQPGDTSPTMLVDAAFELAGEGCTVTTTISAASPASTPAPAAP